MVPDEILMRPYVGGDEKQILDFLNFCYGGVWGSMSKWTHLYVDNPLFTNSDIIIMEKRAKIICYGGMHFRGFALNDKKLLAVLLGDAAVHPEYPFAYPVRPA